MRISQTRARNKFPAHSTIGKALSLCQRKTQLCSFKCEEPLVSHLSVCPVSSLVLCMFRICGGNIQQMELFHLKPKPPLSCGEGLYIEEGLHVEILNYAGVAAPWHLSDMSLQQIFSLLYPACLKSEIVWISFPCAKEKRVFDFIALYWIHGPQPH